MTNEELIEALLDLVDDSRTEVPERTNALIVRGYAARTGRSSVRPTKAGWTVLGPRGRPFDLA